MKDTRISHADIHDPREVRIRELIRGWVEANGFGTDVMARAKQMQKDYFERSLKKLDNEDAVYQDTQKVLKKLSELTNSEIVEGMDLLEELPKGKPVFIALNHFGINKLTTFSPKDVGLEPGEAMTEDGKPIEEIYPFTMYYASMFPIAEALGDNLSEAHLELPGEKLSRLQKDAGLIIIPKQSHQFEEIKNRTRAVIEAHPDSAMVIFPEGETSGKRNEKGPYDLAASYHSGVWGIATELAKEGIGIPVLTAYQYWNPEKGFEVGIIGIDWVASQTSREEQNRLAETSRKKMQEALKRREGNRE